MKIYNINSFKTTKKSDRYVKNALMIFGDNNNIWEGDMKYKCTNHCDVVLLKLNSGEIIPNHLHSNSEETALILAGDGLISQNKRQKKVKKNDLVFLENNLSHNYIAGEKGMDLLVFHSPPMRDRQSIK